ncbi:MAG TPA: CotH kinase family protein [Chitinophagales bacterium]|nr:CotH kinase family protein [Chitinophagales bacterium]
MKKIVVISILILSSISSFSQNPGDTLFNSSHIHEINITFTQPNWWDSLMYYKMHADSFNLSTQTMIGDFIIDGTPIDSVGVQLKGNSSFGYPGRKKPIKITFNEYVSGKKLEGLTVLNLNNNMLDPTMMREKLLLDFMNKKGLAAPRCTYAKVSYNGQYVGLYKMIEQVDKEFIMTHYNDWGGNLFKGDPQGSLMWLGNDPASYYPFYELHSNNTTNDWSDLVNLIDNINNTPASGFYDTLETNLNTTPCIQQWAARNLFVDLDAYFHAPHNYYLYHNTATNKFEWSTWDVSVAFGFYPFWTEDSTEKVSILMAMNPLVIQMLADSIYKKTYLNTICDYLDYLDTSVMSNIIDSIASLIYPAFEAEPDSNQMFPEELLFATADTLTIPTPVGDIPGLKKFIANRRSNVLSELQSIGWICAYTSADFPDLNFNAKAFPNPFSNSTTLQIRGGVPITIGMRLTISDMFGRELHPEIIRIPDSFLISRGSLPGGMYFYQVTNSKQLILSGKLIVQ